MRIQVTLHLEYKGINPTVTEMDAMHRLAEEWANSVARRNSLQSVFEAEVIDVFWLNARRDYLDTKEESPF